MKLSNLTLNIATAVVQTRRAARDAWRTAGKRCRDHCPPPLALRSHLRLGWRLHNLQRHLVHRGFLIQWMLYPGSERPPPAPVPRAGQIGLLHHPREDLDVVPRLCGRGEKLFLLPRCHFPQSGPCCPVQLPYVVKPRTDLHQYGHLYLVAAGDLLLHRGSCVDGRRGWDVEEETSKVAAVRRRRWMRWIWNAGEGGDGSGCLMAMEEEMALAAAVVV